MVGIREIGGVIETATAKPAVERKKTSSVSDLTARDEVQLSSNAAELSALIAKMQDAETSEAADKATQERIENVRKAIEEGSYRVQEVVQQVAARLVKYVTVDSQPPENNSVVS